MGLFDQFMSMFRGSSSRLDVSARFRIEREAILGTMSRFFAVREVNTDELLGLKILNPEKTAAFEQRFQGLGKPSEGEIAVSLKHERIVETHEHGLTTKGEPYLLMEYLEGLTLNVVIAKLRDRLAGRSIFLLRQMAQALAAVHNAGFIHRDICPRNYILAKDCSSLKLIDFGLTLPRSKEFIQPGNRTGTPHYMAPEIIRRRPTDHRVDVFAFGVTAYQMLTGLLPWPSGDATGKVAMKHDTEPAVDILSVRPDLHPRLAAAVTRCISVDPAERPASMEQLLGEWAGLTQESS